MAVTVKQARRPLNRLGADPSLRFHQATKRVTKEAPPIADAIQRCQSLAIRISEVLRDTSEFVAMQQVLSVASHLLAFVDRTDEPAELAKSVAEGQRRELQKIERYYHRAGANAARIVYFWGMVIGILFLAALGPVIWGVLELFDVGTDIQKSFFACYSAGAVGAVVSVLSRLNRPSAIRLDYEVGRPALRRIGSVRPIVGAVFGVVTYFVLESGILKLQFDSDREQFFYYGTLAFIAGFSERWTKVLLGVVERSSGTGDGDDHDDDDRRRRTVA